MAEYKLIVGLPGSGKSHLLKQLAVEGWRCLDDICLDPKSIKQNVQPTFEDERIAIADPFLCRELNKSQLLAMLPTGSEVTFIYFENNIEAALATRSQDERKTERLVRSLSAEYYPINPIKIWSPK